MAPPTADDAIDVDRVLPLVADATARLLDGLAALRDDADVREPSGLPGWSRAHVLTHLARNADALGGMAAAAARGEVAAQYPGGMAQRDGDIEAGAGRARGPLVDDVAASAARLAATWAAMPPEAWDRATAMLAGTVPARVGPVARLAECELHHVDLRLAYGPADWPPPVVDLLLSRTAARIASKAATVEPRTWVVQRADGDRARWEIGAGPAAGTVTGRGADLLAWLAGRAWAVDRRDLHVDGDAAALDLPARVPYG